MNFLEFKFHCFILYTFYINHSQGTLIIPLIRDSKPFRAIKMNCILCHKTSIKSWENTTFLLSWENTLLPNKQSIVRQVYSLSLAVDRGQFGTNRLFHRCDGPQVILCQARIQRGRRGRSPPQNFTTYFHFFPFLLRNIFEKL